MNLSKTVKTVIAIVLVVILGVGLYFLITNTLNATKQRSFSDFNDLIEANADADRDPNAEAPIKMVRIEGYAIYGYTDANQRTYAYWTYGPSFYEGYDPDEQSNLLAKWEELGVEIYFSDPNAGAGWSNAIIYLGLLVVVGIAMYLIMRSMSGGSGKIMNFGKSKAPVANNVKVRFSDVAGAEEEKEELKEVVEFLKTPKKFSNLGAKIPKGVLLVGPPGTGKTLFAKAVAGEAGVPFFSVSGSDFVEMYVGVGASRVRDLFDMAKRNQPCIIFIDEIDAVGRQRGAGLGGGSSDAASVITALNAYFDNPIEHDELTRLSVDVGSDVPFFVSGFRGALVTGKGECVRECAVPHGSAVTLFLPRSRMETSGAYKALDAIRRPQRHLPLLDGVSPTRRTHPNDFEHLYNLKFPFCDRKDDYPYVSLTGSGSAWYMLSSTPSEMVENFTDYDILSQYFVI